MLGLAAGLPLLQLELASEGNGLRSTHLHLTPVNRSTIYGPSLCDSPGPACGSFKTGWDPRVTLSVARALWHAASLMQTSTAINVWTFPCSTCILSVTWGTGLKCFWHCKEWDSLPSSHAGTERTGTRKLFYLRPPKGTSDVSSCWSSFTPLEKGSHPDPIWTGGVKATEMRHHGHRPAMQQEVGRRAGCFGQ